MAYVRYMLDLFDKLIAKPPVTTCLPRQVVLHGATCSYDQWFDDESLIVIDSRIFNGTHHAGDVE